MVVEHPEMPGKPKAVTHPSTHCPVLDKDGNVVCNRTKVADLLKIKKPDGSPLIPARMLHPLEHNQKIESCCRHPENHEIEALRSHPREPAPDIYIFHCTCGRMHRQFFIGGGDGRPVWSVR